LRNSLFGVVVLHGEQAVGMGRVVGDGAICFYRQDIVCCQSIRAPDWVV